MKAVCFASLSLFALLACNASADTLKGSAVRGVLHIDGSSTNDFSPTTATVGAGIEFNATETVFPFGDICEYTANLSASRITIKDVCGGGATTEIASAATDLARNPKAPFTMTFTDAALTGDTITPLTNGLDLTYSLSGDKLTFTFDALGATGSKSSFDVTSTAVTPEPASWQLLLLGLGAGVVVLLTGKTRFASPSL